MLDAARDTVRLQIMFLLGRRGTMNVGDIAAQFQLSRPAISHHLKVLKDAGIVQSEKAGQEMLYRLDRQYVVQALRSLADAIESCC